MRYPFLMSIAALAAVSRGEGGIEYINDPIGLVDLSINIEGGVTYEGSTVFLTTDITLSGELSGPIGGTSGSFLGTFDGLGHTINNVQFNGNEGMVGLFASFTYSANESKSGATIKNLVIGSGSSFSSTFSAGTSNVFIGGIIPYSTPVSNPTIIENCVNMAAITYSGTNVACIGGFIGYYKTFSNPIIVKNCANYGKISSSSSITYGGGMVGYGLNTYTGGSMIINNINFGIIESTSKAPAEVVLGGISGLISGSNTITLCVSMGEIVAPDSSYAQSILGFNYQGTVTVQNNLFSDTVGYQQDLNNFLFFTKNMTLDRIDIRLEDALSILGSSYKSFGLSSWIVNKDNNDVIFNLNGNNYLTLTSSVILIPRLSNNYVHLFDGWYVDESKETLFDKPNVTSSTTLYGTFEDETDKKFTLTFVVDGAVHTTLEANYGSYVDLPMDATKEGYKLLGWIYDGALVSRIRVPWYNVTLTASWKILVITTPDEFVSFMELVENGNTYEGETVFLGNDIDMSNAGMLSPIGLDFGGTFNGMGHTIKNITIVSTSQVAGLFSVSLGSSIMNVILDENSKIIHYSTNPNTHSLNGGFAGYLSAYYSPITINGCVNMASNSFIGYSSELFMGGFTGGIMTSNFPVEIKNCVFFGYANSQLNNYTAFGGIAGYSEYTFIENCLAFGTFIYEGNEGFFYGGILGYNVGSSATTYINNCVVVENFYKGVDFFYGRFVGGQSTEGTNFWFGGTQGGNEDGYEFNKLLESVDDLDLGYYKGNNIIEALNSYTKQYPDLELSRWIGNLNGTSVVRFMVNDREIMATDAIIILTPSLADNPMYWFDGWYSNEEKTSLFEENAVLVNTELYATYAKGNNNTYSVTLVSDGEVKYVIEAKYTDVIKLPQNFTKDKYALYCWMYAHGESVGETFTMPARNVTLYPNWLILNIETVDDFKEFRDNVNTGKSNYASYVVTLENDLEFPDGETQVPIGIGSSLVGTFAGTFNGNGNVIRNYNLTSQYQATGLFGIMLFGIVTDVVLDGSCIVESKFAYSSVVRAYVGSIIGYSYPMYGYVYALNCLNMGTVKHSGGTGNEIVYMGGIVGSSIAPSKTLFGYSGCTNFGPIIALGKNYYVEIGGIVGMVFLSDIGPAVMNGLNNGEIADMSVSGAGKTIGGIVGQATNATVTCSVSYGKISVENPCEVISVRAIVGYFADSIIQDNFYCETVGKGDYDVTESKLFTKDFLYNNANVVGTLNGLTSEGAEWSLVTFNYTEGILAKSASSETRSRRDDNTKKETYLVMKIHSPPIALSKKPFVGWFMNDRFTKRINATEFASTTTIYAGYRHQAIFWDDNSVFLATDIDVGAVLSIPSGLNKTCHEFAGWSVREGSALSIDENGNTLMPNRNVNLYSNWRVITHNISFHETEGAAPFETIAVDCGAELNFTSRVPPAREGYTFLKWSPVFEFMPDNDISVTAQWTPKEYTLTFNFGNGTEPEVRVVKFGDPIVYPNDPMWKWHTFNEWSLMVDKMPAHDLNITATWTEIPKVSVYVEVTFNKEGLGMDGVNKIVEKFVDEDDFTVRKVESDSKSGKTRAVIEFYSNEIADSFIETMKATSDKDVKDVVTDIEIVTDPFGSFSPLLNPLFLNFIFF